MLFADDGQAALEILLREPVDVVVTDIAMPVIDGEGLIRRLYDDFPDLPIVVLSGWWSVDKALARVGPWIRFLSKPVAVSVLEASILEALADLRLTELETPPVSHLPPNRPAGEVAGGDWVSTLDDGSDEVRA